MESLKTLRKKAKEYYDSKEFNKALDYYIKIIERKPNDANAYHDLGDVYDELNQHEDAIKVLEQSLQINPKLANSYIILGNCLRSLHKYYEAIDAYSNYIKLDGNDERPYLGLGNVYSDLNQYDKAIDSYKKALEITPLFAEAYNGLGNVYYDLKKFDEAISNYKKSIEINPTYAFPYNGLGNTYKSLREYDKAIESYEQGIKIDKNYASAYNGLGIVYRILDDNVKAKESYLTSIALADNYSGPVYNLAILLYSEGNYTEAREYYQRYINMENNASEFYSKIAASRIEEIDKLLANKELTKVNEDIKSKVNDILDLLLYTGNCVIHYTSLTVTQALIFDKSKFRLSEGAFLNDTAEGTELFKFLDFNIKPENNDILKGLPFTQKPHIGSFVAENKYNDLTLWRMYGKENKEEAKGCALILSREKFVNDIISEISKGATVTGIDKEFRFFRVAYSEHQENGKCKFIIPGDSKSEKKLNKYMVELKELIDKFSSTNAKTDSDVQLIVEILNDIAYLFKSAEYQHEHELRLVVDGAGFDKIIDYNKEYKTAPPRVYIELVDVTSLIERLTIGPKVEKGEEWAAAFHYQFDKAGSSPQILISHLPYK